MKILVTGGTGFVGKKIVQALLLQGYKVVLVSRNLEKAKAVFEGKCEVVKSDHIATLSGIDAVINLAGEPIVDRRWTEEVEQEIYNSRVLGTKELVESLKRLSTGFPKIFLSASAIGFYGENGDGGLTEAGAEGGGFLSKVCGDWEREAKKAEKLNSRVCIIRIGIVLGEQGGMLKKLLPIFKLGLGGPVGDGSQWMSWIHINDLVRIFCHCLENQTDQGVFNAVSPNPVRNTVFTKMLAEKLGKAAPFAVPKIALKILYGKMSDVILSSQKIIPERILKLGFTFDYPDLEKALKSLLN